ncbi:uncharacterized protein LOC143035292 [Oratosquilla oratoria]|uniref:uncharacterized protein LOC143035292 n=1 Tax=Oratosquilla oratoria TaxID=337810 RepID=UPI003F7652C2
MGVCLQYQWVPSHVGLQGNERADRAARQGALAPEEEAIPIQLPASDMYRMIDRAVWDMWKAEYAATAVSRGWPTKTCLEANDSSLSSLPPHIAAMVSRLRTNHWRTQFTQTICSCGTELVSFSHCVFLCPDLEQHFNLIQNLLGDPATALERLLENSLTDAGRRQLVFTAHLICSSPVVSLL